MDWKAVRAALHAPGTALCADMCLVHVQDCMEQGVLAPRKLVRVGEGSSPSSVQARKYAHR